MLPLVVGRNAPTFVTEPSVKKLLVIVGCPPVSSGTATRRSQGFTAVPPFPFLNMPNDVAATPIVSPPTPVPVVHSEAVAGGGQKPTGSISWPKAETDKPEIKTNIHVADRIM